MKHAIVLLVPVTLSSYAMAQQAYEEKTFLFTQDFSTLEPAAEECAAGVAALAENYNITGINPTSAVKVRINSVQTREKTGKVSDYQVGEIGTLLICQDQHNEANQLSLYYEITIGNSRFIATGGGMSPAFPQFPSLPGGGVIYSPPGFPTETTAFEIYSGTVLPSRDGKRGGVFATLGLHQHAAPGPDVQFQTSFLSVLKVFLPARDNSE